MKNKIAYKQKNEKRKRFVILGIIFATIMCTLLFIKNTPQYAMYQILNNVNTGDGWDNNQYISRNCIANKGGFENSEDNLKLPLFKALIGIPEIKEKQSCNNFIYNNETYGRLTRNKKNLIKLVLTKEVKIYDKNIGDDRDYLPISMHCETNNVIEAGCYLACEYYYLDFGLKKNKGDFILETLEEGGH